MYSILEDDTGHLWMSGPKGISRVSKPDLERFALGKIERFATDAYGMQDGMATSDCEGDGLPTAWKARDGRLWFATAKGVSVIDPDHLRVNFASYPVMIDRIVLDRKVVAPGGKVRVPAEAKTIEIHYTAPSLFEPDKVVFRYRLEGYD